MRAQHRHKRSERRLQEKVDAWNASNQVGTPIRYKNDIGKILESKTASVAWVLGGHSAVIMLEGVSGCYDFERILPTPQRPRPDKGRALKDLEYEDGMFEDREREH